MDEFDIAIIEVREYTRFAQDILCLEWDRARERLPTLSLGINHVFGGLTIAHHAARLRMDQTKPSEAHLDFVRAVIAQPGFDPTVAVPDTGATPYDWALLTNNLSVAALLKPPGL